MQTIPTIVIGAGQAGLAMSRCLTNNAIEHIVFERGQVGNSWRHERWDSLRLLTPNWQNRLPGDHYIGPDRDGFMTMPEILARLERYAKLSSAPVQADTNVASVHATGDGYTVVSNQGTYRCANLVLASGACNIATVPADAAEISASIHQTTPISYKRPDDLPEGGVLVVGASATGVQLAQEIQASGRQVTLSVGAHVRAPRTYRGYDIKWWMDATGLMDLNYKEVDHLNRVRRAPSIQLVGSEERASIDLNSLQAAGVELVGRFAGVRDGRMLFSGSLANLCAAADLKMDRLLDHIDSWAEANGLDFGVEPPHRFEPTRIPASPALELKFAKAGINSVVWATGYRPDYSWLKVPVFDRKGRLQHDGGVVAAPGLYAMGLPFMRRRKSTLIDGVGDDAGELVLHMLSRLIGRIAA